MIRVVTQRSGNGHGKKFFKLGQVKVREFCFGSEKTGIYFEERSGDIEIITPLI